MSSIHGTIRRYQLIIKKLKPNTYTSMREMEEFLNGHGFENSRRTVQRDFEKIRYEIGVEIVYNRSRNGYSITSESRINVEQFLRLANLAQITQIIAGPIAREKELLNYVSFEAQGSLIGLKHIAPLFQAIRKRLKVEINHSAFYRNTAHHYKLQPYLLKEYNERWYVVAWVEEKDEFRSFGIDRIDALQVTDECFDRDAHPDPADLFKDTIGIIHSDKKAELVELAFEPFIGKYIKTLPLHDSQVIVIDNDRELRIQLMVIPNIELERKILSYGSKVKVNQPDWLAEEIASELKKSIAQYK
ncbi:MAG: WYL domain-containing protein [Flavobacteriales bacterium]|nr:WYL domain-containing protein [Flavobacteriales bacterium]